LLWCRDAENNWDNELVKGIPPAELDGLSVDISDLVKSKKIRSVKIYDPWKNESTKAKKEPLILLPGFKRSVVVRIENK
jgi:hypothetical protein